MWRSGHCGRLRLSADAGSVSANASRRLSGAGQRRSVIHQASRPVADSSACQSQTTSRPSRTCATVAKRARQAPPGRASIASSPCTCGSPSGVAWLASRRISVSGASRSRARARRRACPRDPGGRRAARPAARRRARPDAAGARAAAGRPGAPARRSVPCSLRSTTTVSAVAGGRGDGVPARLRARAPGRQCRRGGGRPVALHHRRAGPDEACDRRVPARRSDPRGRRLRSRGHLGGDGGLRAGPASSRRHSPSRERRRARDQGAATGAIRPIRSFGGCAYGAPGVASRA